MSEIFAPLQPYDELNQALEANVHPRDWQSPVADVPYHLVVIGAGTAGLVTAIAAAGMGARVALVEQELMGGDCLNVGCVPSKALIAAARAAAAIRDASEFGITPGSSDPSVDFSQVMRRMREKRAGISPVDSAARFQSLGVDVYFGQGSFSDRDTIRVTRLSGEVSNLKFRRAVIATGARAAAPPINGLENVQYLTNETLFSLTELPPRLGIVGSGPIGCEMAQSFARFGSEVFLFERADRILTREDADAAQILQKQFADDGVQVVLNANNMQLENTEPDRPSSPVQIRIQQNSTDRTFTVDKLLIAVGRAPNVDGLNLENVGVTTNDHGVMVNDFLQTTNPNIFAAGDVCSQFKFTHAADFQARIVIQNALFALGPFGRKKASSLVIPWATYTSPEVAHVGLSERLAQEKNIEIDTWIQSFEHVDRAILEGTDRGFVKIHTQRSTDKIVGATIVAENAGDLISEVTLAMQHKIGLGKIASVIHPYPTQAEAIRKLGDQFNRTKLTPTVSKILNLLRRLNVGK